MIRCGYLTLPDSRAQLHYRTAGEGPPLIMLHPSPQNSQVLEPAMAAFAKVCTCIALDAPGYGQSDDPLSDTPSLKDYGDLVFAAADALGLDTFFLYGAATGAQIAIEMGKHQPERLSLVLLDANGHIDKAERDRITQGYFAPVTPRRDGGHLLTLWDMCSRLFTSFPWNSDRPEDRLPIPRLPTAMVHTTLLRYFDAGKEYAKAYRLAFDKEDIAHLHGFAAPAVMTRWEGSAVLRIADDFIAKGLPDNVRLLRAGPDFAERYAVQIEALREAIAAGGADDASLVWPNTTSGTYRSYAETPQGQLHMRCSDNGEGARVVLLHGAGASLECWSSETAALEGKRPFIAFDLPGHGHSRVSDTDFANVDDLAAPIVAALQASDLGAIELVGEGLGGAVALAIQRAMPDASVTLLDPAPMTDDECAQAFAQLPDLTPQASGAHLLEAWHCLREDALRWPWFDGSVAAQRPQPLDQSPATLHRRAAAMLRLGSGFRAAMQSEIALDWRKLVSGAAGECTIALTQAHPCPDRASAIGPVRRIETAADLF